MVKVLELHGFRPEDGRTTIFQKGAENGVFLGRPSYKTEDGRVAKIPGCGPKAGSVGVSHTHARITWQSGSFVIEPWAGSRVAIGDLDSVIDGPRAIEDGQQIFFGPIAVRAEVIVQEEER